MKMHRTGRPPQIGDGHKGVFPSWLSDLLGAWRPLHGRGLKMTRRRFWPVSAVLVLVGIPVSLFSMYLGAEVALVVWFALCGVLLVPAVLRRLDDAGLHRALALVVLAPMALAVLAALMVPLICLDGITLAAHDAVYTSLMLWIPCLLPMVFLCSWPSSASLSVSVMARRTR